MSTFKVDDDCILFAFKTFRKCISDDFHHCDFNLNNNEYPKLKKLLLFIKLS